MYCDNCGKELNENARFCPKCGQKVIALSDLESGLDSAGDIVVGNNSLENPTADNNKRSNSKSKKKGFIVAICALIIVIFVGLAIYLIFPTVRVARQMKLGNKYLLELDYEQAVAALTKALEINPDDEEVKELLADAYVSWGEELVKIGELELALAKIDEARDILGNMSEFDSFEENIRKKQAEISEKDLIQKENEKKDVDIDEKGDFDIISELPESDFSSFSNLEKGQYVTLGNYEQDGDLSNGKEPIEWEVLRVEEGRALLISRYVLDQVQFNTRYMDVTWETCTLRSWMNNDFYNSAFTDREKNSIQTTRLENSDNPIWGTEGGNDTDDKVFCLSVSEIMDNYSFNTWSDEYCYGYSQDLIIEASPYAGIHDHTLTSHDCTYLGYPGDVVGKIGVWWWTRSLGPNSYDVCLVSCEGGTGEGNLFDDVFSWDIGVRPAIWVSTTGSTYQEPKKDEAVTENLRKQALDYYERHNNYRPSICDVEDNGDGTYILHLYDVIIDGPDGEGHTATSAWYLVDEYGVGEDSIFGDKVDLRQ